jgi:hypothetical protein
MKWWVDERTFSHFPDDLFKDLEAVSSQRLRSCVIWEIVVEFLDKSTSSQPPSFQLRAERIVSI